MNVKEVIEMLTLCPQDWEVLITSDELGAEYPVETILQFHPDKVVWMMFKDDPVDAEGYEDDEEETQELDTHAGDAIIDVEFEEIVHRASVPA